MKKLAFIILLSSAFATSNAQTNDSSTSGASFGFKGGVNFSNLYTDDVDDNNVLTGFNAGIFISLPLTEMFSIQPEFLYTTKGAELVYNNAFAQGTGKFRLNYIEVPVLLKVNLTNNLNIHAGPYFAYLIDAKISNESSSGNFDFEDNLNNDDFNKFDYGLSAGIGFDFDSFGIGARYNYGLATVGKERDFLGSTYTFPDAKNSNLSIYAAIKF
ncbi:porin family protein [Flavobacterium sp. UBA6135]|uniref:porin family protein n=1 Tax=Flavobacterium sp. UBA6135 TaxID=1946553 RepID=UPI0025BE77CA|nr:porin family protein [Flavobacterium sp. UBA6135]